MTPRPRIRAYVIGPMGSHLDLFYTLPTAIGAPWAFEYALLERDGSTIELLPDVHRDHQIGNAILVVEPSRGIGGSARKPRSSTRSRPRSGPRR